MTDDETNWDELEAFMEKAAASVTQKACLLKGKGFHVGIGEALSTTDTYLTMFIKIDPDQEGYALSMCLTQEAAAKLIGGLVQGYNHLYGDEE